MNITSSPPASKTISPATSSVKSPEDKSISVPSMVILSALSPALAVNPPDTSTAPFISIVVALSSSSVSETKSNTPSALCEMCVPESPNCN